eukprot:scaffold56035_cov24-Tisochrysis_lutea.AAC.1
MEWWDLSLGKRRRPQASAAAARLAYDLAQVPATHALGRASDGCCRVSALSFDHEGELVASASSGGRVGVQQIEQFVPSA